MNPLILEFHRSFLLCMKHLYPNGSGELTHDHLITLIRTFFMGYIESIRLMKRYDLHNHQQELAQFFDYFQWTVGENDEVVIPDEYRWD